MCLCFLSAADPQRADIAGTIRARPSTSTSRSAARPRTQPIASAIATWIPPLIVTTRMPITPIDTAAPAIAPVV